MKEIKDYFLSPQTKLDNEQEELAISVENPNLNSTNGVKDRLKKKCKKRKKRKQSDPVVRDVAQLLSDHLKFSPNNTIPPTNILNDSATLKSSNSGFSKKCMKENTPVNNESYLIESSISNGNIKTVSTVSNLSLINKTEADNELVLSGDEMKKCKEASTENSIIKASKLNAFQLMMDKRNKSIGSNSPGKELDKDAFISSEGNKEKFTARKNLFLKWADEKGALKRKRFEEEKDEIIHQKLKIRAKRLKKLLNVDEESDQMEKNTKRNRVKKIVDTSEGSDDDFQNKQEKEKSNNVKIHCSDNLDMDCEKKKQIVNRKKKKVVLEHNLKLGKKKSKNIEVNVKSEKLKHTRAFKEKTKYSSNADDIESKEVITGRKIYTKKKESKQLKTFIERKSLIHETTNNLHNNLAKNKSKNFTKVNNYDSKVNEQNVQKKTKYYKQTFKELKSHTHTKSKINLNNSKNDIIAIDESSPQRMFSLRTPRSWKMKVKINTDESVDLESMVSRKANLVNDDSSLDEKLDAIEVSSDSDADVNVVNKPKKLLKIAPVFRKCVPKPKEDQALIEARKQFLMSSLPSSLKKNIEKQNSNIEPQFNVFPITEHIQQKCTSSFWKLCPPDLKFQKSSPLQIEAELKCEQLTKSHLIKNINLDMVVQKVDKLKELLNRIKAENPNYPVYKSFRQIYEKSGCQTNFLKATKESKKVKRKCRRKKREIITIDAENDEFNTMKYVMWTEKYKPKCSDDIVGNFHAVKNLKKWLECWKPCSQQINSRKMKPKSSSESEFDLTDCDSRDSCTLPGKSLVLGGPCGSGKSSAVYAVCNELGFNVIELNASSKRTGKRLLQDIQEATQSHQVRKEKSQSFSNYFQSNSRIKDVKTSEKQTEKNMCIILVEDVDVLFEQDEGFMNALMQLVTSSKRPIIVTTTDYNSIFVQKFFGGQEYVEFLPLSFSLSTWLQIVFLIEGMYVSQDEIGSLLEYNKGDVRKTLLQLQFWVQSGGQLRIKQSSIKLELEKIGYDEQLIKDEKCHSFLEDCSSESNIFEHKNIIESFEILEIEEIYKIPLYLNLGLIWWNITNILNLPNFSVQRINSTDMHSENANVPATYTQDKQKILLISKVYDALSYADILFTNNYIDVTESLIGDSIKIKDSLELSERLDGYRDLEFVHELTHFYVNGCIKKCETNASAEIKLNITMSNRAKRKWKSTLRTCENAFENVWTLSTERKSVALDYFPVLRNITRSECSRAANNTKRGNRFRNYLLALGVKCKENIITNTCQILNN